jgi:predicted glycosyltransferase
VAVIRVHRFDEFRRLVARNCTLNSHIAITDNATYVVMTPVVTSQHRHYVCLEADEDSVKKAVEWLAREGFEVIEGEIELKQA